VKTPNILFFSDPFWAQCAHWLKKDSEEKKIPLIHYEIFLPHARLIPFFHHALMAETRNLFAFPSVKTFKTPFGYEHSVYSEALPLSELSFQGRFLKAVKNHLGVGCSLMQARYLAHSLLQISLEVAAHQGRFEDLNDLVPEKLSQHFQKTYDFLKKFAFLPLMRQYIQRFQQFQEKQCLWRQKPPTHPVVALGFCPFFSHEKQALHSVLQLAHGAVIFQEGAFKLPEKKSSAESWASTFSLPQPLSIGLTPPKIPAIYLVEAQNLEEEAFNIALLMHQAEGKALLVCQLPEIFERVVQHLRYLGASSLPEIPQRYQDHPLGVFLKLLLDVLSHDFSLPSLLALAQHPMTSHTPLQAKAAKKATAFILQNRYVQPIPELLQRRDMRLISTIWKALQNFFQPLAQLKKAQSPQSLKKWIMAHMNLAESLNENLFTVETQEIGVFFKECILCSSDYPFLSFQDYLDLFQSFLQNQYLRSEPRSFSDQKYFIQDMETARLVSAERVIIAGLNEGMLPFFKRANPWVNSVMKQKLNLPMESDEVARQTEIFMENIKGDQVFLTRSEKIHGEAALPSRFWTYIQTYANPLIYPSTPVHPVQNTALPRFSPCLFLSEEAWPSFFSVSDLQLLFQNPYAFYIKKVLNLKTLSFPQVKRTLLEKGLLVHALLEDWAICLSNQFADTLPIGQQASRDILENSFFRWAGHYGFAEMQELREQIDFFHLQNSLLDPPPLRLWVEKSGKKKMFIDGREVVFYAKADRIDLLKEGAVRIIDYKTGQLPTLKALKEGESVQLVMESFLAMNQAFIPDVRKIESIQAWQLKSPLSKSHVLTLSQDLDVIAQSIMDHFKRYFVGQMPLRCLRVDFGIDLISRVFEESDA
jgi:inactivated superfamily I helicase